MNLSENFRKRLLFLSNIKTEQTHNSVFDQVKQIVWNANSFDDCLKAIKLQYGNTVPLFHATTPEKAILIDKEGLKLTYGKNYTHFGEQLNLYFQIGKSDYHSSERSVLYKFNAPLSFIAKYCNADTDSFNLGVEDVNNVIGRNIEDRKEVDSYDTEIFIHGFVNNNNLLEGLELIVARESENDFPFINAIKVSG